mgnify:CR=1 FL=1
MPRYSSGRFALRISDRDGFAYPYNEMVQEWTGAWVHTSEYEPKSPLLNPTNHPTDAQSLQHAKPQVVSVTIPLGGIYINDDINFSERDFIDLLLLVVILFKKVNECCASRTVRL